MAEYEVSIVLGGTFAVIAGFISLTVLGATHLRFRILVSLWQEVGEKRRKNEQLGDDPAALERVEQFRTIENDLRQTIERDGIRLP